MTGTMTESRPRSRLRRGLTPERVTGVEVLVLAPLAAILVLWLIPTWFQIDWGCVSATGVGHTSGDTYITTFAVFGTLGWLLVAMAALFANVTGANRFAQFLPVVWFAVLVGGAAVTAATIGPAICG
jgi:hypothetical protein